MCSEPSFTSCLTPLPPLPSLAPPSGEAYVSPLALLPVPTALVSVSRCLWPYHKIGTAPRPFHRPRHSPSPPPLLTRVALFSSCRPPVPCSAPPPPHDCRTNNCFASPACTPARPSCLVGVVSCACGSLPPVLLPLWLFEGSGSYSAGPPMPTESPSDSDLTSSWLGISTASPPPPLPPPPPSNLHTPHNSLSTDRRSRREQQQGEACGSTRQPQTPKS